MREHRVDKGFGSYCGGTHHVQEIRVSEVRGQSVARLTVLVIETHGGHEGSCDDAFVSLKRIPNDLQWDNVVCGTESSFVRVGNRSKVKLVGARRSQGRTHIVPVEGVDSGRSTDSLR